MATYYVRYIDPQTNQKKQVQVIAYNLLHAEKEAKRVLGDAKVEILSVSSYKSKE